MNRQREVKEIKEVNAVKEPKRNIAAFFDLDGTLMAGPSMERRFFRLLRYRREIAVRNYWLWLREAVRLMPGGIRKMLQANKMYLRGVQSSDECSGGDGHACPEHDRGGRLERRAASLRHNSGLPIPTFFAEAVERVAWHAKEKHAIVLMSGTLKPLAEEAVRSLEARLEARGMATGIRVCATRLEEKHGRWTGKILDVAMFGEAKARAVKQLAEEMRLDLGQSYAYGDSSNDRWLLAAVGQALAVNPSKELAGIARTRGWPILNWEGKENLPQRRRARREVAEKKNQHSAIAGWNW